MTYTMETKEMQFKLDFNSYLLVRLQKIKIKAYLEMF